MKKRKIKIEKVYELYTANEVPFDYAYWTEEDVNPCPECGSRVRLVGNIMDVDYFCPFCVKYVEQKCGCGECSSESRSNRPITLPDFRKRSQSLEDQDSEHIEIFQEAADHAWVVNLLDRIRIYEKWKYLSPQDNSLIDGQTTIIEEVLQLLGQGKNDLSSLLYFKAAIKIIMAELVDSSNIAIYNGFVGRIDNLVQNENSLEDAGPRDTFKYKDFYENIVKLYYPDEIEEPDDKFDSMYSAEVEEKERELNQKLEHGWEPKMKEIKSMISEILSAGGEVAGLLEAHISLSDVDEFINHLLKQQEKLDSEIFRYEFMSGNKEE